LVAAAPPEPATGDDPAFTVGPKLLFFHPPKGCLFTIAPVIGLLIYKFPASTFFNQ